MLSLLARAIGHVIILGLAVIGAETVAYRIMGWKDAHDKNKEDKDNYGLRPI